MVKKKTVSKKAACTCPPDYRAHMFMKGILLLLISGALYMGYGWKEILGALGILVIIKGLLCCR